MSSIGIPALDSSETKLCRSSRGPFLRVEPGVLGYLAERTPNVGRVERGAALRREYNIIVGPSCRASHATLSLPASMRSKRYYAFVREFKGAPRRSRLGVPALSH